MSLSYRKGDRTKRDDTAIAELKAGQDKIFELLQGLAGELRELKGSVGAVQTGFARSSWEQRDQETMKSVKAGKPWELGFGIAPAPTPSKEQRPSKDVVTSYTRLEDEKDGEDEKNGGATVVAGKRPPGAGIPQYADVAEMGRNFANDSGGGPVVGQLLVNAADSDPVKALTKMVGFVIIGYAIYGSHPYRINNYDEDEDPSWDWGFVDSMYFTMATLTTVGYGDMPTLPQHMRLITIVFGLVGVLVIAGQIGVVVDYLAEKARLAFIKKQQELVVEAGRAAAAVNDGTDALKEVGGKEEAERPSWVRAARRRLKQAAGVSDGDAKYYWDALLAAKPCFYVIGVCLCLGEWENFSAQCESEFTGIAYGDGEEGCWTLIDSVYFAVITLTTIGYGDVTPTSEPGRLVAALLMPFAIFSLSMVMSTLHNLQEAQKMGADKTLRDRLDDLKEVIAADDNGTVAISEYIIFNLKKMGKVDTDTVELLTKQFLALDADGSGELDADDIKMLTEAVDALEGWSDPYEA